ncbi:hypothetical protein IU427_07715 [Nocardia beijingensis]|uniref:hypothetical protein n=1 Tax=Nocardia beijingensis TaxID=95162 RepID=UPI001896113E|nr:hypothetical protein [Nocardia beijingensis]MBF6465072.1 hypothetical protein [Nocardia beijingensis]
MAPEPSAIARGAVTARRGSRRAIMIDMLSPERALSPGVAIQLDDDAFDPVGSDRPAEREGALSVAASNLSGGNMVGAVVRAGSSLLAVVAGVALLAGCGSGSSADPAAEPTGTTTSTATSTAAIPAGCPALSVDPLVTGELKTALTAINLPVGACLTSVHVVGSPATLDELAFLITLAIPTAAAPDDLRPIATDIAHVWKKSELGQRTSELAVTNWAYTAAKYVEYLTDERFRDHPWDGTPSREAEMAIWTVTAKG